MPAAALQVVRVFSGKVHQVVRLFAAAHAFQLQIYPFQRLRQNWFEKHVRLQKQGWLLYSIDYKCKRWSLSASASCVVFTNPVNSGIRSGKKTLIWTSSMSESHSWYIFQNEAKSWEPGSLQHDLEMDNFKPRLERSIFKCISWLNGLFFGGWNGGLLKEGVNAYSMAPMSPLD
jgi:hypothetical protein